MKIGIILSVALVLVLGGFFLFMTYSPADDPTSATGPAKLEKAEIPDNLPAIFEPTEVNRDANAAYAAVFSYYNEHLDDFVKNHLLLPSPTPESAARLTELLIEASKAGQVSKPFLDDMVPMKPGAEPVNDPMAVIRQVALNEAKRSFEAGNPAFGIEATKAVFALGQRAFGNSVRMYNRWGGLAAMTNAWSQLAEWYDKEPGLEDKLHAWQPILDKLEGAWAPKIGKIVKVVRPQIGDLINVARNDKDITFRLEATLQLGVAKFNARSKGNERAIKRAIEAAKSETDPLISAAGAAAEAFTVEEMRKM